MQYPISILLVDDDLDDQEFFVEAISRIEKVSMYAIANNGQEALDRLANQSVLPDFIFLDINMPKMNGMDCLTALVLDKATNGIPVIVLTTSSYHMDEALRLGAKDCIIKPITIKILKEQIEKTLITGTNGSHLSQ